MSHIGLLVLTWGFALAIPAYVDATEIEAEVGRPVIAVAEIEKTTAAIEGQLGAVTLLIRAQDAKLDALLDHIDEIGDPRRKALLQDLADKNTRALDKLEAVKADLSATLDALMIQIDHAKEP